MRASNFYIVELEKNINFFMMRPNSNFNDVFITSHYVNCSLWIVITSLSLSVKRIFSFIFLRFNHFFVKMKSSLAYFLLTFFELLLDVVSIKIAASLHTHAVHGNFLSLSVHSSTSNVVTLASYLCLVSTR